MNSTAGLLRGERIDRWPLHERPAIRKRAMWHEVQPVRLAVLGVALYRALVLLLRVLGWACRWVCLGAWGGGCPSAIHRSGSLDVRVWGVCHQLDWPHPCPVLCPVLAFAFFLSLSCALWSVRCVQKVLAANPSVKFGEVGKILGEQWRGLSGTPSDL